MPTLTKVRTHRSPARRTFFAKSAAAGVARASESQEPVAAVAHDARNLAAALELCCDLLAEPGVLGDGHRHIANDLRAVAAACSGLVQQLSAMHVSGSAVAGQPEARDAAEPLHVIDDLAAVVRELKWPLAAMAGAKINLEMECLSCFGGVALSRAALTRILINLTRNAAEAMPQGGRIRITVQQGDGGSFSEDGHAPLTALLCVQDSGLGIPKDQAERIFEAGFTTKSADGAVGVAEGTVRGQGLSIVRRLAESAGGRARAVAAPGGGARIEVELPLIGRRQGIDGFTADFPERENLEC